MWTIWMQQSSSTRRYSGGAGQAEAGVREFRGGRAAVEAGPAGEPRSGRIDQSPCVEVDSSERVHGEIARFTEAGLFTEEEINTTCCFATQDKVWVTGPNSEKWEVYTVLADSETFGTSPRLLAEDPSGGCACETSTADANGQAAPASCC